MARSALGDMIPPSERTVTMQQIVDAVVRYYNVRQQDLQGKRRHKSIRACRESAHASPASTAHGIRSKKSGPSLAKRDHTTVLHAVRTITRDRTAEPPFAASSVETLLMPSNQALAG